MAQPVHYPQRQADRRIRLGVSACLLGQQVRYDGGHKRDRWVADVLSEHFELIPVCPEVAIGLGTPRAPIHLTGPTQALRAVGVRDGTPDVTDRLAGFGRRMAGELAGISGYVFKSNSPSCGVERVPVHDDAAVRAREGRGIYAAEVMGALPSLPIADERHLGDPALRQDFIERVYAYRGGRVPGAADILTSGAWSEGGGSVVSPRRSRREDAPT